MKKFRIEIKAIFSRNHRGLLEDILAASPAVPDIQELGKEKKIVMGWKQAYQEKADEQLREWQARIERFKSEPILYRHGRVVDKRRALQRLTQSYLAARSSLDQLYAASDLDWEAAKHAVELSMIELKRALDESGAGKAGGVLHLDTNRSHIYEPFSRK